MKYLKKPCPFCGEKKLYEDSDGDGIDTPVESWVVCASCDRQVGNNLTKEMKNEHSTIIRQNW